MQDLTFLPQQLRQRCLRMAFAALAVLTPLLTQATTLTVSAASSLTNALREIGPLFESVNPGVRVQFNFAGSGALLQQIAAGAPVDVFASADQETMDRAQNQSLLLNETRADFASNTLVVVVPANATQVPKSLQDLVDPSYSRIAIGQPSSVPVGRYTQAVLEGAGLWASLAPRMINATNVRQTLDYVQRGEVQVGFVYATDAALLPDQVRVAFVAPTPTPVTYPAAVIKASTQPEAARAFVQFLQSAPAQEVFARFGFGGPQP